MRRRRRRKKLISLVWHRAKLADKWLWCNRTKNIKPLQLKDLVLTNTNHLLRHLHHFHFWKHVKLKKMFRFWKILFTIEVHLVVVSMFCRFLVWVVRVQLIMIVIHYRDSSMNDREHRHWNEHLCYCYFVDDSMG